VEVLQVLVLANVRFDRGRLDLLELALNLLGVLLHIRPLRERRGNTPYILLQELIVRKQLRDVRHVQQILLRHRLGELFGSQLW